MSPRKLQPSRDHVLVKYKEDASGTKDTPMRAAAAEPRLAAMVIAIGPGRKGRNGAIAPVPVSVGDRIFVNKTHGIAIRLKNRSYAVVRARDLIDA
jgi:chaperonin GroES